MKKMPVIVGLLGTLLLVVGCSTTSPEKEAEVQRAAQRLTIVSSAKAADVLPAFTTFTWSDKYSKVLSDVNDNSQLELSYYIRSEIIQYLKGKGYIYQADPAKADVVIGYLFALEDDAADKVIQARFGLLPGISAESMEDPRYGKGTLLLAVLDPSLKQMYWRSALQGFVNLDQDKDASDNKRMQSALNMMLGGFPKAGQ